MLERIRFVKQWTKHIKEITYQDETGNVVDKKMIEDTSSRYPRGSCIRPGSLNVEKFD